MSNKKKKHLSIERFEVARFRNSNKVVGGNEIGGDDTPDLLTSKACKEKK